MHFSKTFTLLATAAFAAVAVALPAAGTDEIAVKPPCGILVGYFSQINLSINYMVQGVWKSNQT